MEDGPESQKNQPRKWGEGGARRSAEKERHAGEPNRKLGNDAG